MAARGPYKIFPRGQRSRTPRFDRIRNFYTYLGLEVASAHAAAQISSPIIPNWTESLPTVGVNHFTPNFMSLQLCNGIVFVRWSSIAFKSGLGGKYCFLSLNFTYFSLGFLRSSLTYCHLLKSPILQIIFEHWKIFWFLSLAFQHICCSLLQS
jgi:hypothetical protein